MKIVRAIEEVRTALAPRSPDRRVGLVPTMGALHEGHLSLVRAARKATDTVVVSIFVNPLQFGPAEDLATYPRDEEADLAVLRAEGVDVAFLPTATEMYPGGHSTLVDPGPLAGILEGAVRPGHFAGVATVVAKLLNVVQPEVAFFGQKDAQQLAVVRRVVSDLSMPVDIRGCPTVRDADGLALSSRNVYLDENERVRARSLYAALQAGARVLGEEKNIAAAEKAMTEILSAAGVVVDYAVVVDPIDFTPFQGRGRALLAVAGRVGSTRLIDNLVLEHATTSLED